MSLKLRIDLLIGALLFLGLAADVARMVVGAGSRVRIESESMTRITRDFITSSLANLPDDETAEKKLGAVAANLTELRHIRVTFSSDPRAALAARMATPDASRLAAPEWFYALVGARPSVVVLPAMRDGRRLGDFVIAGDPADEVNEVWQDVKTLALTGGLIALAALFGASRIVARTLAPLQAYGRALGQLKDGDYSVRAEARGSPEFLDLCAKLNALAEALDRLSRDNRDLIERLMTAQEEERKAIAHELHDEIGPHLFALRANAALLRAAVDREPALAPRAAAICGQVEALQETNRRILRRLRPPALDDLGVGPALRSLVDGWRETQPEVRLALNLPEDFELADSRQRLVVYRLVQEALTNVFKHSGARNVEIAVSRDDADTLRVRVEDDGAGLAADRAEGLGLAGMRERARGLGGRVEIARGALGGCRVEAWIPQSCAAPPRDKRLVENS
ncbi:two-component system sensor histidine kinase UhpB [Rhodoblastus acidophilus]|uniref:ATP-binding protein n=1 Tax=Rhodoblastus acidophilus TaxID=1074 RepID=UPI0022248A3C|nr:ATP-binding protein [Rhodoblastus acidophilus]MCW2283248.1 two-component system sensor histidine kinase UhpB [Rhodoblastus acidophilus]MCW2332108.1 two-component system sensor histidine kinase UhpB [Rhodoblastus acidophilus]